MALRFHELPLDAFDEKARPYIARLNKELRDLFALEAVMAQPVSTSRSDGSIVRGEEPQVAVTRITPSVATVASDDPSSSTSVTAASGFGADNRVIRSDGTGRGVQVGAMTLDDSGNLLPVTANAQDLGSPSLRFMDLYTSDIIGSSGTIIVSGTSSFQSTMPNVAGNVAFDLQDTIAVNRTGTSYMLGLRDSAGTYRFRVASAANTQIILTNSANTAATTFHAFRWTFGDNAGGTSADPALTVVGTASANNDNTVTAGTQRGLVFKCGSNVTNSTVADGAAKNRMQFLVDGSGSTANDNFVLFDKQNDFANVNPNDWINWRWTDGAGGFTWFPTDARRFFHAWIDAVNDVYISQGGRWGNQAARVGYAYDTAQFITWDLLLGGGFGFTGVGAEPIT